MTENPDRPPDQTPAAAGTPTTTDGPTTGGPSTGGPTTGGPSTGGPTTGPATGGHQVGGQTAGGQTATRTQPGGEHRAPRARRSFTAARRRTADVLATVISVVTTVVVLILAVHIVFAVFEANTANGIVSWFGDRAAGLSWQFKDIFQPDDPKMAVAVNYGLAALVYLVTGRLLTGLARRLG
ncbi:hypothetical protein E1200_18845 [Actinomadura sp. GC306]|uniref:hypothetical protein n=1 Tax=Actinomadura sp. GC306 TaxID=2530367 RepID=UPI001044FAEC|nr:hypothetical protein [Actinomadura sp. GC306]TDC65217.1 hypothetical protein E1200_18845 [Actinomadura sp. GC306]